MSLKNYVAKFESPDDETKPAARTNTTQPNARSATMNANIKFPNKVTTGVVRIVYPNLAEPRPEDAEIDAGKYSVLVLIPKEETATIEAMEAAIEYAKTKKFPKIVPKTLLLPIKDGDEKFDKEGNPVEWYAGHYYLNLKSNNQPKLIDPFKNEIEDASFIKGGDWCKVRIAFSGYDMAGNKGVGAYVDVVQFVRAGDPLGNSDTLDDFDVEEGDDIEF